MKDVKRKYYLLGKKKLMELLQIRLWENIYSLCMTFLAIYYAQGFYGFIYCFD